MPEPTGSETREQFFDRCMADPEAVASFPDANQRGGFCASKWMESAQQESVRVQAGQALSGLNQLSAPHLDTFLAPAREALAAASATPDPLLALPAPEPPQATAPSRPGAKPLREAKADDTLGAHSHDITPEGTTDVSGNHRHLFRLDDGTIVSTAEDGEHEHPGPGTPGTPHTHKVTLPDGVTLDTAEWSDPGHEWLVTSTTWNGTHPHDLNIPGGNTLISLDALELSGLNDIPSGGDVAATEAVEKTTLQLELSDSEGAFARMTEHIGKLAASGHSFQVVVDPDDKESRQEFGFDGDGSFRVNLSEKK